MTFPTPHGSKLRALRNNVDLPDNDQQRVEVAITKYEAWIAKCKEIVRGGGEIVEPLEREAN